MRIQRVAGNGGGDDNLHLTSDSPAIDRGDPVDYWIHEPVPHGQRINLGAYGNTTEATMSEAHTVQLIHPTQWEKFEVGQPVDIQYHTSGVSQLNLLARVNAGGPREGLWGDDQFQTVGQSLYFAHPIDITGVTNRARRSISVARRQ